MNSPMNCERFSEQLAELLEREVPEQTRAAMEAHAIACDECGPLLADLRRLRVDAANLPTLTPTHDLWSGIAARIETPVVSLPATQTRIANAHERRVPVRAWWLGIAAAALVAVTATITHEMTKRAFAPATTTAANVTPKPSSDSAMSSVVTPSLVPSTAVAASGANNATTGNTPQPAMTKLASNKAEKPTADQTYDHEISKLRAVLEYRRHDLDSATVSVVDKNLKIIDEAIAQCRVALKKDPASRYLLESLNEALDSKVQLLRTAATLPPRT